MARARVGAKFRTGPLLDITNENVAGRQVYGEYVQDIVLWSILNTEILNVETFNYGE